MDLLYKYYSINEYSLLNIADGSICFNDLMRFNDPFEGIGEFFFSTTQEQKQYWDSIGSNLPDDISKRFADDSKELLRFNNRVLSLTSKFDHPLMWSHYADSHTGFCVGYSKTDISNVCDKLKKVTYTDKPKRVSAAEFEISDIESLLYMKSDVWEYEDEWRAVYSLKNFDMSYLDYNENFKKYENDIDKEKMYALDGFSSSKDLMLLEANKHIIKQCQPRVIYLGLKVQRTHKDQLLEIAKREKIKVFQMAQERNSYKMVSNEIST